MPACLASREIGQPSRGGMPGNGDVAAQADQHPASLPGGGHDSPDGAVGSQALGGGAQIEPDIGRQAGAAGRRAGPVCHPGAGDGAGSGSRRSGSMAAKSRS